jgi:DNA polymerase-1
VRHVRWGRFTYLIDCFQVDPAPLWEALSEKELIIHNAAFDLGFLGCLGFTPCGPVHDTMLMSQVLNAGTFLVNKLAQCCERELGIPVDKTQQTSDWSGQLTTEQLDYAALDPELHHRLYLALAPRIEAAGLSATIDLENRCRPAALWMGSRGFRSTSHDGNNWLLMPETEATRAQAQLDAVAPQRPGSMFAGSWNWSSTDQVKDVFALAGSPVESTGDDVLATLDHPIAELLRQYRDAKKRATTYGHDWLKHVAEDGRVYPGWNQTGAKTGRMSCSSPNLQNIPRDPAYRRCFAAPPGHVLIKADYSQIEMRIGARIANETRMIEAYQRGEDLHTLTARSITGRQDITKEDRQLAKPVNFGLIYGLSVNGLRRTAKTEYGIELSEQDAKRYRTAFFDAYPAIARWHNEIKCRHAKETRTLTGQRVIVESDVFYGGKARRDRRAAGLNRSQRANGARTAAACTVRQPERCSAGRQADAITLRPAQPVPP